MRRVLTTAPELAERLAGGERIVLLDVRWVLGDPHGREHYLAGHLPGAVFVDLHHELAATPTPATGRHPLPEPADLQAAARRWGIRAGDPVVVYDDSGSMAAARAWWLLRWAGLDDVTLLDGGLGAWRAHGGAIDRGEVEPPPGDVELGTGHLPAIDIDAAATWAADGGVLLDARAGERFRGEIEPIDPRAGHIPGARSAPTADNLTPDGHFRSPDELRDRFAPFAADGGPIAVYCGSGVTAAHEIAALAVAGIDAALFAGSWSQWSNDPDRPVATGPD